jgi:ABC-type branched-subunit amino acid transport system ATPase component
MSLLEVEGLNSYYGDSHILFDVSLRVEPNEVVALLGRNGAGKSTTLKSLMGVVTPKSGSVKLLKSIRQGRTMIVIDHDMDALFELAERVTVLQEGRVLTEGTPDEIKGNPAVREAYLGGVLE